MILISHLAPLSVSLHTRQEINFLAYSSSPLKWTETPIQSYEDECELRDSGFNHWRLLQLRQDLSYPITPKKTGKKLQDNEANGDTVERSPTNTCKFKSR